MKLQVASWLEPTINHLWKIRKQIIKDEETNKQHLGDVWGFNFDYPDYAGLPKALHSKLPRAAVLIINTETYFLLKCSKSKKEFVNKILVELTNGCVIY